MKETIKQLQKSRSHILVMNIVYFLILLCCGISMLYLPNGFFQVLAVAVCLVVYLFLVRPSTKKYIRIVRTAVLQNAFGEKMQNFEYRSKEGISVSRISKELIPENLADKTFLSREHIICTADGRAAELADVTFPVKAPDGRNEMFTGCMLHFSLKKPVKGKAVIHAGQIQESGCSGAIRKCLEELAENSQGTLYLCLGDTELDVLCRGTFLYFRINPLYAVSEASLAKNPVSQWTDCLQLAQLCEEETGA